MMVYVHYAKIWMRELNVKKSQKSKQIGDVRKRLIKNFKCLRTFAFDEIGHAHQLMHENKHPHGNMACLVNATETGQGTG